MSLVIMYKFNTPKKTERNKKRYQFQDEVMRPYWENKDKEVKVRRTGWSNGTGFVIGWWEFETLEDFKKVWGDEEFQIMMARYSYFVDNAKMQILWPSKSIPPK